MSKIKMLRERERESKRLCYPSLLPITDTLKRAIVDSILIVQVLIQYKYYPVKRSNRIELC